MDFEVSTLLIDTTVRLFKDDSIALFYYSVSPWQFECKVRYEDQNTTYFSTYLDVLQQ